MVHRRGDVAVGVQGEHHRGVPESVGHDFGWDARGQTERGVGVTQVVEADAR